MHKNCPHVKVRALAPLRSAMFSAKGITAFEQLTWEQRPSQGTFILNPFNSYYNHQSSAKTLLLAHPFQYQCAKQWCCASACSQSSDLESHSSLPTRAGLAEHPFDFGRTQLDVHLRSWQQSQIRIDFPSESVEIPIMVDSLRSNQYILWNKKRIVISVSSQCWWLTVEDNGRTSTIFSPRKRIFCMLILYLNIYPNPSIHISALSNHQPISNVSFVQKR